MKKTRRGFTLVELLIVIVVIGVLAAMMMLSSSEAVSSARASTIITNLRNLKTAALAMYNDNMDKYDAIKYDAKNTDAGDGRHSIDEAGYNVLQYLSGKGDIPDKGDYELRIVAAKDDEKNGWFIVYHVKGLTGTEGTRIRNKLAGRAAALGLIATKDTDSIPELDANTKKFKVYDGTDGIYGVALQVR